MAAAPFDPLGSCFGKHAYANRGEALECLRRRQRRHQLTATKRSTRLEPYRCRSCGKWHIGSEKR